MSFFWRPDSIGTTVNGTERRRKDGQSSGIGEVEFGIEGTWKGSPVERKMRDGIPSV